MIGKMGVGIVLFVLQVVFLFGETVAINHVQTSVPLMQLALARNCGTLLLSFLLFGKFSFRIYHTKKLWLQLLRAVLSVLTMWTLIYSYSHLALADATSVTYTQAVFLTTFSLVLLREAVPLNRWIALAVGILGTIIVIRPAFQLLQWSYWIALVGVGLNALVLVITKPLERMDTSAKVMAYVGSIGVLCNCPSLYLYKLPSGESWAWITSIMFLGPIGMYLGIQAIRLTDISILAPWVYLRLILACFFEYYVLKHSADVWTLVGATMIFLSCGLSVTYKNLRARLLTIPSGLLPQGAGETGTSTSFSADPDVRLQQQR